MSRSRVPTVLVQLYGIQPPKALNLRVIEGQQAARDDIEPGTVIFDGESRSNYLLKQFVQEHYYLADAHVRMKPREGSEDASPVPVVYLTFSRLPAPDPVFYDGIAPELPKFEKPVYDWLTRIFNKSWKAVRVYRNEPSDRPAMVSINMTWPTGLGGNVPVPHLRLHDLIWVGSPEPIVEA